MLFLLRKSLIFSRKYCKVSLLICLALFFTQITLIPLAKAEGSYELVKYGGYRPYLLYATDRLWGTEIDLKTTIKVFVNAGEQVNLGSSVYQSDPTFNNEDIVYYDPAGTKIGFCDVVNNVLLKPFGYIKDPVDESYGPEDPNDLSPDPPGYTPCTFKALITGIYQIEFHPPLFASAISTNIPPQTLANQFPANHNDQKVGIAAWDVTVFKTHDIKSTIQKGRVYANYLPLYTKEASDSINSQFFILSRVGHRYHINLNGIQPIQFIFFANNKGFKKDGTSILKSVIADQNNVIVDDIPTPSTGTTNIRNPGQADDADNVTYKIFFNEPVDLPAAANSFGDFYQTENKTWLLSTPPSPPVVSNFKFMGSERTPNQAGTTGPQGGTFSFETSRAGNYILSIDIDGDGIYGNNNDRVLIGTANVTPNSVAWDGLDGQTTPSTLPIGVYKTKLLLSTDEVHFPFFDVENNSNGLIIQKMCPDGGEVCDDVVYYDDTDPNINGFKKLDGEPSFSGAHRFNDDFGNEKGIDTWTSITAEPSSPLEITIKEVDLKVTKTHSPDNPFPGGTVTYTLTVESKEGTFSDVTGIRVEDVVPSSLSEVTWTCTVTPVAPGNRCAQSSGTGNIDTTVDLKKGAVATFMVEGIISDSLAVGDKIKNKATITTPNDVSNKPDGITEFAEDTIILEKPPSQPPVANDDNIDPTPANIPIMIPVLNNDYDNDDNLDKTSVTVTTPPKGGTTQVLTDGRVNYIPNTNFSGTDTFIYKVCDTDGLCDSATVMVTVIMVTPPPPIDPHPIAESKAVPTITNDKPVPLPPLSATDNGTIVSYTITTLPLPDQGTLYLGNPTSGGILIIIGQDLIPAQAEQLFFNPNQEFTGDASFTYIAMDNAGGRSEPALVTIPIQAAPQPPIANDDNTKLDDRPVTISILANDSDPDGELDPQSITITTPPSYGTTTINLDGTITYLPQPGLTNGDTFSYQVCDTGAPPQCDTATVTITISTTMQLPPVAINQVAPLTLNNTIVQLPALLAQDSDGIITVYTIATLPLPTQGILYLGDPTKPESKLVIIGEELSPTQVSELFFQPDSHFTGNASFTYTATDDAGAMSNSALVTIPVVQTSPSDKLHNPLFAQDDQATTALNTTIIIAVLNNDHNPEGQLDFSSVQIISPPTNGDLTVNSDGTLSYTPHLELTGLDIFTYKVCDLGTPVQCDTAQVTVRVIPLPPTAQDIVTSSTLNNMTIAIPPLSAKCSCTIISYTIVTLPSPTQGTLYLGAFPMIPAVPEQVLTPTEATDLWFQPNPNWVGEVTFNYRATDNQNQVSTIATVTIPVTLPPDYKPQFTGKIRSSSGKVGKHLSIDAPEYIWVTGYIQPSLVHRGQLADIIVTYHWTPYSGKSALTVPVTITSQQQLAMALMEINLFEGYLIGLAGQFDISLGYQLHTGELFSAPILTLTVHPNRTPTALTLSHQTVLEYSPADTLVGSFSTDDPDNQEQFRYGLVENPGNYFKVVGDELRVSRLLTSQAIQPSYPITVRSVDLNGDYIEQTLAITALSAEISPQELYLTHHQVLENSPSGTIVGRLWTQDLKPGRYSYKLLNQARVPFTIAKDLLLVAPEATLDFETQPAYTLRVQSQKVGTPYHLDQTFTIELINQTDVTVLTPNPLSQYTPPVTILLKLLPDITHQGQQAKFMSVILWRPSASKKIGWYRLDRTRWVPWQGELAELLNGQAITLTRQSAVTLVLDLPFDWTDGEVDLLAGYQLPTGEIFYSTVPWQ